MIAGDFLESVPDGGDVYTLKWILHNWSDADCLRILGNCRRAMGRGGRLLVIEQLLPASAQPPAELVSFDIGMMVLFGAQERTEAEYRALLTRSGFEVQQIASTAMGFSIIEAVPTASGQR